MSFKRMGSDEGELGSIEESHKENAIRECNFNLDSVKIYVLILILGAFVGMLITISVFYINSKLRNVRKFDNSINHVEEEENIFRRDSKGSSINAIPSRQGSARITNEGSRRMSKTHSLLEQELRRSPLPSNVSNAGSRNNGCLNCKLIIMGESISYADGRCPQCGDDQEQRRMK